MVLSYFRRIIYGSSLKKVLDESIKGLEPIENGYEIFRNGMLSLPEELVKVMAIGKFLESGGQRKERHGAFVTIAREIKSKHAPKLDRTGCLLGKGFALGAYTTLTPVRRNYTVGGIWVNNVLTGFSINGLNRDSEKTVGEFSKDLTNSLIEFYKNSQRD